MRNTEQESKMEDDAGAQQSAYQAIHSTASSVVEVRPDPGREQRKGVPEIVFGETKDTAQIIVMAQGLECLTAKWLRMGKRFKRGGTFFYEK